MAQRGGARVWALACASACLWLALLPAQAQAQVLSPPHVPVPSEAAPAAQNASQSRGQQLVESRCFACHSLDENRVGPALRGVVGRVAGKAAGYVYSDALAAATHTWNGHSIQAWLTDPEQLLPGQRMNYRLEQAQDRADVVAYLVSLSDLARP